MTSSTGYIKLHRKLLDWHLYNDETAKSLFLHLLLKANYQQCEWNGITLQPGQLVTSVRKLCEELQQTNQQTRTALDKLKATNEITINSTNKFSVITVVIWAKYQYDCEESNKQNNEQISNQITNKTENNNKQNNNSIRNIRNNKELKELFYKGVYYIAKKRAEKLLRKIRQCYAHTHRIRRGVRLGFGIYA